MNYYSNQIKNQIEKDLKMIDYIVLGCYEMVDFSVNKNSLKKEVALAKIELINKVLIKTYSLFMIDFSIEWEKNIVKVLDLCGFISMGKNIEYKKLIY